LPSFFSPGCSYQDRPFFSIKMYR